MSEYNFSYEIGHTFLLQCGSWNDFGGIRSFKTYCEDKENLRRVEHYLRKYEDNLESFLSCLVALHNTYEDSYEYKNLIFTNITQTLNDCGILYDVITDKEGIFIFPKGAKELDNALVSETLEWLVLYPKTHKAFSNALKAYSNNTDETASEVADLFRKTLETFFQEFLNSEKSLENMTSEYKLFMKTSDVPAEIKNNLWSLVDLYAKYMNNYAKHKDKVSQNLLEFIMYQTGNIIRLMITLKDSR